MSASVAMHVSDGVLNAPVSALFALVAVVGVWVAATGARRDLDERAAPMAGLVAAFVFATQMLNFPVLPGVSGHALGGALAAILVGPWAGALCITIVVALQSLIFADGGLTAIGANVTNMALIGTVAGYLVALALRRLAARGRGGLVTVAFLAGLASTVAAALGFVLEFSLGGDSALSAETVTIAIVGVHILIGVGEGVITALTVAAVAAVRPDLVYLLRVTSQPPDAVDTPEPTTDAGGVPTRRRLRLFYAGFALLILTLAGVVSYLADSSPDGLESALPACQGESTSAHEATACLVQTEETSATAVLPDYTVGGDRQLVGIAGVLGVLAVLAVAFGVYAVLRNRHNRSRRV
jgi:cobalt/nickel transport system permease protein